MILCHWQIVTRLYHILQTFVPWIVYNVNVNVNVNVKQGVGI